MKNSKPTQIKIRQMRKQVDQVDRHIARLIKRRISLANTILKTKKNLDLPTLDKKREKQIFDLYSRIVGKSAKPQSLKHFLKAMKKLSEFYPKQ